MLDKDIVVREACEVDPNLLRMLDRGLEDIESGNTLTHEEAVLEVNRLREERRNTRKGKKGLASNG